MSSYIPTPTSPFGKNMYNRFHVMSNAFWPIMIIATELVTFDSVCSIAICTICSFYVSKLGYWLGHHSSTPQMASVFSDKRVLQGSFYPQEVRFYAQLLLCLSLGTLFWSVSRIYKTLEHEAKLEACAVSPKLPFLTPLKSTPARHSPLAISNYTSSASYFDSVSHSEPSLAIRAACFSRIKKFAVLFCFCLAFLRGQRIAPTLIYHPVTSPLLLQTEDVSSAYITNDAEVQPVFGNPEDKTFPQKHNDTVVPSIVHFVFGMEESFGGKPFGFAHYLSMYSAITETRPEKIMFWHHYLPSTTQRPNWWFERLLKDAEQAGVQVEMKKARQFDSIFGRPVTDFAHKADIIRLEALLEFGGIYLDLDVYTIRSFEPLRHFDTVLGLEGGVPSLKVQGLCNGIIVSKPNSTFLQRWYESYRSFDKRHWADHSVEKPLQLALQHPTELLVLDPYALFYPAWDDQGLRIVHSRTAETLAEGWDFEDSHQYAYHAWSKFAHKRWLSRLTPDKIFAIETSFNIHMRRWTSVSLREDWKIAKQKGLVA